MKNIINKYIYKALTFMNIYLWGQCLHKHRAQGSPELEIALEDEENIRLNQL